MTPIAFVLRTASTIYSIGMVLYFLMKYARGVRNAEVTTIKELTVIINEDLFNFTKIFICSMLVGWMYLFCKTFVAPPLVQLIVKTGSIIIRLIANVFLVSAK